MKTLANIRTINAADFRVTVRAVEDYDVDLSFDESGEVRAALEKGELEVFGVEAVCTYKGMELSSDFLGGCIYASPAEFMDHLGIRRTGCGSYFSQMVRNVCQEARKTLCTIQGVYVRPD